MIIDPLSIAAKIESNLEFVGAISTVGGDAILRLPFSPISVGLLGSAITSSPNKLVPAITVSLSFNWIAPSGPKRVRLPYPEVPCPGENISSAVRLAIIPATRPTPVDFKGIAQDTIQAFKPTFKEKALDTALQAGSDIAVSYVTNKLLGKTFAGSLATSSPFMTSPYTAAAGFAFDTGIGQEAVKGVKQVAKKVVKAPKKIIKAVSSAVGTVICTELYKQNLMSKEDHRLSWNFTIDNFSNTHINGYWYWAVPMVKLMKKNKLITKFWNHIMSNRTKDIKWRLKKGKFNLLGRLYSMLIENGSYVVGKLISKKHKEVLA